MKKLLGFIFAILIISMFSSKVFAATPFWTSYFEQSGSETYNSIPVGSFDTIEVLWKNGAKFYNAASPYAFEGFYNPDQLNPAGPL